MMKLPAQNPIRHIPFRIILPVVMTVLLFILTIFQLILPMVQERLLDGSGR